MNHDWMPARPPCRDLQHLFFPDDGAHPNLTLQAKAICQACPARKPCDQYATRNKEPEGVWGGRTPKDRRNKRPFKAPYVCVCPYCNNEFLSDQPDRATCGGETCVATKKRLYHNAIRELRLKAS